MRRVGGMRVVNKNKKNNSKKFNSSGIPLEKDEVTSLRRLEDGEEPEHRHISDLPVETQMKLRQMMPAEFRGRKNITVEEAEAAIKKYYNVNKYTRLYLVVPPFKQPNGEMHPGKRHMMREVLSDTLPRARQELAKKMGRDMVSKMSDLQLLSLDIKVPKQFGDDAYWEVEAD